MLYIATELARRFAGRRLRIKHTGMVASSSTTFQCLPSEAMALLLHAKITEASANTSLLSFLLV
jgi:hypothetical protein